jgi:hypothetical protein
VELSATAQLFKRQFGFLFLGFKLESYFWEAVVSIRKTTLYIIAVAFRSDLRMQVVLLYLACSFLVVDVLMFFFCLFFAFVCCHAHLYLKGMLGLLTLNIATVLHTRRLPYSMDTLSRLELLSLLNSR